MKYYYLDSDKKPQGPYNRSEMESFKESGFINDETLMAAAGESKWRPLKLVLSENEDECSTWNNETCSVCPECETKLSGDSSHVCTNCGCVLRKREIGLFEAFVDGFKRSFSWKGRATRTYFWGFVLFSFIFQIIISELLSFVTNAQVNKLEKSVELSQELLDFSIYRQAIIEYLSDPLVLGTSILAFIINLVFIVPFLSVSVRRLHDTGRRATAVVTGIISWLGTLVSVTYFMYIFYRGHSLNLPEGLMYEAFNVLVAAFVFISVWLLVSLYLFIMMLLPGNKGKNQYGI